MSGLSPATFTLSASNISYVTTTRSVSLAANTRVDLVIQRINGFTPVLGATYQLTINVPFRDYYAGGGTCAVDSVTHPYQIDGTLVSDGMSVKYSRGSDILRGIMVGTQLTGSIIADGVSAVNLELYRAPFGPYAYVRGIWISAKDAGPAVPSVPVATAGSITPDGHGLAGAFDGWMSSTSIYDQQFACLGHYTWSLAPQ
jgi:hypothetical protein